MRATLGLSPWRAAAWSWFAGGPADVVDAAAQEQGEDLTGVPTPGRPAGRQSEQGSDEQGGGIQQARTGCGGDTVPEH